MADISDVRLSDIKEISDSLEGLSCKHLQRSPRTRVLRTDCFSSHHDSHSLLEARAFEGRTSSLGFY